MAKRHTKPSKAGVSKTSIYLPDSYFATMDLIKDAEQVRKSHQIQIGLLAYFEKHRKLIEANGLNPWKQNAKS